MAMKAITWAVPEEQLSLFDAFLSAKPEQSRTLDIWDLLPKFLLTHARESDGNLIEFNNVKIGEQVLKVSLSAAILSSDSLPGDPDTGPRRSRMIFPGEREELVERALRKMAVQRQIGAGLAANKQKETVVRLSFTLSQLRRELQAAGHDFKIAYLAEAMEVLGRTLIHPLGLVGNWEFSESRPLMTVSKKARHGDKTGRQWIYTVDFHPLAVRAILLGAWQAINYKRVMELEQPLARWIVTRMNNRFRQAPSWKERLRLGESGYTLTLTRILAESGIRPEKHVSRTISRIEEALKELSERGFLGRYEKEITYDGTGGRPRILDVRWTLFPSFAFASEIARDNHERKLVKAP
jgi:hypothetical protein